MYWILAAVFLLITLTVPRLRPASIVGLAILAAMLVWGIVERARAPNRDATPRGSPTSPAAQLSAVPLESVAIESMQLAGGGAPFELRGRIVNRSSDVQLRSVTIRVTRRDCYEGALDPSGCALVWQDRHWMPVSIPPAQSREFSASIWMRGSAPRPRGELQDSFELLSATGQSAAPAQPER